MSVETITEMMRQELQALDHSFEDHTGHSELKINGRSVRFNHSAKQYSVDPDRWIRGRHVSGGVHEPGLVACISLLSKLLKDKKIVFYDIGALFGYHAFLAHAFFGDAKVVSVEGNPYSSEYILQNAAALSDFHPVNAVMGVQSGQDRYVISGYNFNRAEGLSGLSFKLKTHVKNTAKRLLNLFGKDYETRTLITRDLKTITIDDLLAMNEAGATEIFKIDTEGYQAIFLPPYIAKLCDRNAIVLLELDKPDVMKAFGCSNDEILQLFRAEGYQSIWLDHRSGSGVQSLEKVDQEKDRNSLLVLLPGAFVMTTH